MVRLLLCVALTALSAGCSLGPAKLPATRMDYNIAVQRSSNEEMLLNLVRMKHFEQPLFLQVGAIASTFNYNVSAGATGTFPDQRDFLKNVYYSYAPTFTAQYSDSPTVTYTPYQGQTYAQQFLAEIDLERFVVLYRAGWDIEYLVRILVTRMGRQDFFMDGRNGYLAPDTHRKILELSALIGRMDDRGELDIVTVSPGKDKPNVTLMTMRFKNDALREKIQELIGMDIKTVTATHGGEVAKLRLVHVREHELAAYAGDDPGITVVPFSLRNCLRAMDLLSQGIDAPKDLVAKNALFDLRPQFSDIMDIRSSRGRPQDAYVAVQHAGWWYFIRSEDSRSKEVFQLMLNIFALQSADPPKNAPVLTLPVGGN
jgi:hypothetical protein